MTARKFREEQKPEAPDKVLYPNIYARDNWALVVNAINRMSGLDLLRFDNARRNRAFLSTTLLLEGYEAKMWIEWRDKRCIRCGNRWKVHLWVVPDAEMQTEDVPDGWEVAKPLWGPAHPTCECDKNSLSFRRAMRRQQDDDSFPFHRTGRYPQSMEPEKKPAEVENDVPF